MGYQATIIDGAPALAGSCCDMVHVDDEGNLLDPPARWRLVLQTSIGRRFVHLCELHDGAVGVNLARWSHSCEPAQRDAEDTLNATLTEVLRSTS